MGRGRDRHGAMALQFIPHRMSALANITPEQLAEAGTITFFVSKDTELVCPVTHRFQPGVYLREIFMPAGAVVVGNVHRAHHQNIVLTGMADVEIEGERRVIKGGDVFESHAGARKFLKIIEDMRFITLHENPDNERDIDRLEARMIDADATTPEMVARFCQMLTDETQTIFRIT